MRRPTGPWTPTIHGYLHHLRAAGFTAAPEVLGIDQQGRESLRFIPGETLGDTIDPDEPKSELATVRPWPSAMRSDRTLAEVGRLYGELHRVARGFRPDAPKWREHELPMRDDEIVCHGDAGPWNVVYRDGHPIGLIDWDGARPDRPVNELAWVAWHFVPLGPEEHVRASGFTGSFDGAGRLQLLCDAYGLPDPEEILPALSLVKQLWPMKLRYWQPLPSDTAARLLRTAADDLDWLDQNADDLRRHLR